MTNDFLKSTRKVFIDHIHASRAQLNQLEALVWAHIPDELPTPTEPTNPPHPFVIRNLAKQLNNNLDEAGVMLLRIAEQYAQLWQENEELRAEVLRLTGDVERLIKERNVTEEQLRIEVNHNTPREEIWE